MNRWTTPAELEAFLKSRETGLIFKHSTRCAISAEAMKEVEAFEQSDPKRPVHLVLVVEDRPVSNAVAELLGVKHASPQVIWVEAGEAVWNGSHWAITKDAIAEAASGSKT